ncbi:MAG: hypothetical protein N2482_03425, partial [Patescibacteria group bacterium]|nr:hypothetical protein [Patescibacteria group bacterium]
RVVNQSPNKEKEGPVCWRSVINKSGQSVTGRRFGNIQYGSISGYKWEDLDGDGVWNKGNEPVINGDQTQVTIFIDLNKNGEQEEGEPRTGITNNGSYSFTNLLPGSYNVCERDDLLSGWIATTPKCYEVNVNAGQETKDINFGNFKLGRLTVTKFHDRNQDGKKDDDEEVLGGWIINLASNSGTLSGITATNSGQLVFDNLLAGDYSLSEEKQSDWRLTNIYCDNYQGSYQNDFYSLTIKSRDILDCYLGNYHQPILTLAKSNNVYPNSTTPGSVVSFTLKIKVQNNNLYNVLVKDILPPEFSFNNVWSATLNGKSITLADPHYASPGTWILGDLKEGDEIMINYQAKVKNSVQPGVYKDLAWGVGNEIDDQNSNKILALSTDSGTADSGIVDKNFVGTKVVVDKDTQNYTSVDIKKEETKEETGQVLGASTGLPATGSKFIWLIIGSVFSLLGLILIGLGLSWKKIKLFNRILGLIIVLGTCSLITNNVFAGSLSVRLSEPKSPTRTSDFNLNFVALDFVNNPIAVKCFYKKDGGSYQQFDSVKNLSAGGNAGSCRVTNSQLNEEGKTYSFYVEADNGTETVMSEIVSVDYKTSTPGTPTNYSKEHPSSCEYKIKFKTADDGGKTKKVEIYRSRDTSFPLDGSTRTASIPIGSNTDYTYTETVPSGYCNDTWYYAVRAFDDAGNGSGWVGDAIVTIKTVSTTTTQTTTQETGGAIPVANVTLPAETTTGNIEGATTEEKKTEEITKVEESEKKEEVLGEKTERKSKNIMEKAGEVLGQATKKENKNKILFAVLAMVLLSIIGYAAYNIKNQRQKSQT